MKIPKKKCNQNMKTIKKTKKTIETRLEANLMNEPMSALFFLKLIEIDCDFFWPELKTQAKSLNVFFLIFK